MKAHGSYRRSKARVWAAIALTIASGVFETALADAAAQARRLAHFEWLRERGVFESRSVVDGVPRLVIGTGRYKTDDYSLAAFCKIVFDYYAEENSAHTRMLVIDAATNQQIAYVDATGYHGI